MRHALVMVGLWLGMSVSLWVVASTNFRTVDTVLEPGYRAEFEERLRPRSATEERPLLRFLASELNRRFFRWFGVAQLVLAGLTAALVWPKGGRTLRALAVALAVLTLVLGLVLAPAVARLGPPLDFVPRPPPPAWEDHLATFMRWHAAYMVLDLVKVVLLATVAGVAARRLRAG